jgi:uncharacterized DUF497 family protein
MNGQEVIYEWDEVKRQKLIATRGLDIAVLGPKVMTDPALVWKLDDRKDYGEPRYLAYGSAYGLHFCVCYTPRGTIIRLITIFRIREKDWRKYHETNN